MLTKKKESIKIQLDKELSGLEFTKQQQVLDHVHSLTWKQKIASIWNKEIELPLLPLSAVFMLLFLGFGAKEFIVNIDKQQTMTDKLLIEVGGNVYWKDDFERMVIGDEN